jgi:hypothetical protein
MSEELEQQIRVIVKQQGGGISPHLRAEFQRLCQEDFAYRPDITCGKCIYKHSVKLFDKYLK